jgi:hypothetical protein
MSAPLATICIGGQHQPPAATRSACGTASFATHAAEGWCWHQPSMGASGADAALLTRDNVRRTMLTPTEKTWYRWQLSWLTHRRH